MFYQISTCRKRCESEGKAFIDRATCQPPDTRQPTQRSSEQPYLARRQNWVNQLERHAMMQPASDGAEIHRPNFDVGDLQRRVAALAGALSRRGVGFGDRVMILMLNRTEFIESVLAPTCSGLSRFR